MKTNPYVAMHRWKALSLRIVRRPEESIFIKTMQGKIDASF